MDKASNGKNGSPQITEGVLSPSNVICLYQINLINPYWQIPETISKILVSTQRVYQKLIPAFFQRTIRTKIAKMAKKFPENFSGHFMGIWVTWKKNFEKISSKKFQVFWFKIACFLALIGRLVFLVSFMSWVDHSLFFWLNVHFQYISSNRFIILVQHSTFATPLPHFCHTFASPLPHLCHIFATTLPQLYRTFTTPK